MGELRMTKEMIISSTGHETMVVILEDDLVAEIFVERERQRGVVGNVYKGRVSKVLPGMQSSFIDLGLERDGFLYVADIANNLDDLESGEDEDETSPDAASPAAPDVAAAPSAPRPREGGRGRDRDQPLPKIEDLLHEGQEI